ncbi:hypothetical protein PHMEG_00024162 [Phytophthora megakarya]|uniref:Reverse transcriptase domain-containing protein n=1 Tax=Phytophthora megakarya TaxID=4795 RepID=A0A225VFV6_9STRA|nr:hypothetical protein PHMEG_00024162 [Phytophthora megakarya]
MASKKSSLDLKEKLRRGWQELYTLVYDKAVEHERYFQQNKRMGMTAKDKPALLKSAKDAGKAAASSKKPGNHEPNKKLTPEKTERKVDKKTAIKNGKKPASTKEPPSPCPKCQEMHWLSECTKATDAEKVVLRQKLRETAKARKSRTKGLKKLLPSASRTVTINGVLELPCCPDTGSDHTVISQSQWKLLLEADPSVQAIPLDQPVRSLAYSSHPVVATKQAMLHILIPTAASPVQPAEAVSCLIMEEDDDELSLDGICWSLWVSMWIANWSNLLFTWMTKRVETLSSLKLTNSLEIPITLLVMKKFVLLLRALFQGFPADKIDRLRTIVHMYDVWRLELRANPPARVPPLEPRKYPPHIRQFLREFNATLVELGWIYENPTSRWASPVLPVKKSKELMDMRQTTDYREFNSKTDIMAAVMPILSLVMENARGKQHFGLFDFIKGFWQLPLAEFCQEWLSYMTDEKIFTPRRVPQGCGDAAIYFQKTMESCFATLLYKHLLVWIDDLLLYDEDIDKYRDKLQELFSLLDEFGLKLSVKKSSLYQKEVKWCGKIIDANGVRHEPARIDTLRAMPYPSTAGELQQFLCAVNWMRESLIDYARQVSPLQHKLDEALAKTRRTKRVAAGISIELSADEKAMFDNVKDMLSASATLAFPDDSATTCLLTDASDVGWAVIVTQVKGYDMKVPVQEQQHQLVECLVGTFTGSELNWTVIEKEAFPIALACDKLDYLLFRPQGFRMFCDHHNLIHVFAPDEHVKKHVKGKLLRWAIKLMNYNYVIEHIAGPHNVWADMISRWAGNHVPVTAAIKRVRSFPSTTSQVHVPDATEPIVSTLRPLDDANFVWPTFEEIKLVQSHYESPHGVECTDTGIYALDNRIWIPAEAKDLTLRLFIIAHCGAQGHRGIAAMVEHLRRLFAIENLRTLPTTFVRQCRLCLHSKGGTSHPQALG